MTDDTRTISLGSEWVAISDGVKTIFMDVKSGVLEFCLGSDAPSKEAEGHNRGAGFECTITPPTKMWGRAAHGSGRTRIVLSQI
ncbi:hypothetical protein [Enterobacter asburiae]|uniref:hypothetical protein n=1 Tax=Enterobacter asburiae TaxID=61645 RepID=UPI00192B5C5D|nr:hypothetical protein [Enterobacter asburiae]MBL5924722.1 hypothetical protein [Enterobacter asburiae]MBL5955509.1 hypothetical protein [Enterobacter asburiae]